MQLISDRHCVLLIAFVVLGLICYYPAMNIDNALQQCSQAFHRISALLAQTSLQKDYDFIPYPERYSRPQEDSMSKARIQESHITFAVINSYDIMLAFDQSCSQTRIPDHHDVDMSGIPPPKKLVNKNIKSPILVTIGIMEQDMHHFQDSSCGLLRAVIDSTLSTTGEVSVGIHSQGTHGNATLGLRGVWVRKGGHLKFTNNVSAELLSRQRHLKIVSSSLLPTTKIPSGEAADEYAVQSRIIVREQLKSIAGLDVKVSIVPVAPGICITMNSDSRTKRDGQVQQVKTVADLYFGQLHSWGQSQTGNPSVLILEVGLWDFQSFLADVSHHTAHAIESFISRFATAYVDFILVMRRNLIRNGMVSSSDVVYDESYIYNSLPSTTPIFLMLPSVPPSFDLLLQTTLSAALHKTVLALRYLEGDTQTIFLDTSGWLDDTDFAYIPAQPGGQGNDGIAAEFPVLHAQGHEKVAHFLSLHICPYLWTGPDNESERMYSPYETTCEVCPFEKHQIYHGDMYVPDERQVAMVLEERKVAMVKELLNSK